MGGMNKKVGNYGEGVSRKYLINKGYSILKCNYRTKFGEIDIIARNENCVVFVEVKTRSSSVFGMPREAVTHRKQQILYKLAQHYLVYNDLGDKDVRFDVIEVRKYRSGYEIEHIENAF